MYTICSHDLPSHNLVFVRLCWRQRYAIGWAARAIVATNSLLFPLVDDWTRAGSGEEVAVRRNARDTNVNLSEKHYALQRQKG